MKSVGTTLYHCFLTDPTPGLAYYEETPMLAKDQRRFDRQYQKHLDMLKLRNMSESAIDVYSRAVRRVVKAFDGPPDQLDKDQYRAHFAALIDSHSWSTVRSDRAGLTFFFEHVLDISWDWNEIVRPKTVHTLPDVISYPQVAALINAAREQRIQSFFLCTYSMGLRLREALSLTVQDIDAEQLRVHVRLGKNNKDCYVFLPRRTLGALRDYWKTHRHPTLLFPAGYCAQERFHAEKPMSTSGVQRSIKRVALDAGIRTHVTPHTLRHAYATHLLERGLSLHHIRKLLGHVSITTTLKYTHLTECAEHNTGVTISALIDELPVTLDARL